MEKNIEYRINDYLYMNWLRPEGVVWDAVAAKHISSLIPDKGSFLEVGIGNGYTSFMMLGGSFVPEYDWYFNTNVNASEDIYDVCTNNGIVQYIKGSPRRRIECALDQKSALVEQTRQLAFCDTLLCADANLPLPLYDEKFDIIYSNMIYWLTDPLAPIKLQIFLHSFM